MKFDDQHNNSSWTRSKIMAAFFEAAWKLLTAFKHYIYAATAQVVQTLHTLFNWLLSKQFAYQRKMAKFNLCRRLFIVQVKYLCVLNDRKRFASYKNNLRIQEYNIFYKNYLMLSFYKLLFKYNRLLFFFFYIYLYSRLTSLLGEINTYWIQFSTFYKKIR